MEYICIGLGSDASAAHRHRKILEAYADANDLDHQDLNEDSPCLQSRQP